ncbi:MAG: response regulator [Thermodesulfobacteriota bacterium]
MGTPSAAILVVDDDPGIAGVCVGHLRPLGLRVRTAPGAGEAIETLAAEPVAVLLSDHCMPGMNGATLLERVWRTHPDVVRILFTGEKDLRIAEEATARGGIFRFLAKPFSGDALRAAVLAALEHRVRRLDRRRREELVDRWLGNPGVLPAAPPAGGPEARRALAAYGHQESLAQAQQRLRRLAGLVGSVTPRRLR